MLGVAGLLARVGIIWNTLSPMVDAVNFTNGQLLPTAQHKPNFTLYQKTNDRTKQRRIMVSRMSAIRVSCSLGYTHLMIIQ